MFWTRNVARDSPLAALSGPDLTMKSIAIPALCGSLLSVPMRADARLMRPGGIVRNPAIAARRRPMVVVATVVVKDVAIVHSSRVTTRTHKSPTHLPMRQWKRVQRGSNRTANAINNRVNSKTANRGAKVNLADSKIQMLKTQDHPAIRLIGPSVLSANRVITADIRNMPQPMAAM